VKKMSDGDTLLWVATANKKKAEELRRILSPLGYELRTLEDLSEPIQIIEDAPDFFGNAMKKAATLARATGTPAIGDDSGLCVDALGGRPGIHSARYAGVDANDGDRIAKILREMEAVSADQRSARFVCCICLVDKDGEIIATFEEYCEGTILMASQGSGGFGYDPIFSAQEHANQLSPTSFAELSPEEKDSISHRGQALRRLTAHIESHPLT